MTTRKRRPANPLPTLGQIMYDDVEIPTRERAELNPHVAAVATLVGTDKAKRFQVVEYTAKRHINWLRLAGPVNNVSVRIHLTRNGETIKAADISDDETALSTIDITFWTVPRITRPRGDKSENGHTENTDENVDENTDEDRLSNWPSGHADENTDEDSDEDSDEETAEDTDTTDGSVTAEESSAKNRRTRK